MTIESALKEYEEEMWMQYNHEHKDVDGNWIDDTGNEEEKEVIIW